MPHDSSPKPETHASDALTTSAQRPLPAWVSRVVLTNLPFAIALGAMSYLPEFIQAIVVGAILFLVPGLAWTDQRKGDAAEALFRILVASLVASLAAWLALAALPGPTSRIGLILALTATSNVGLWFGVRRGWYDANPFGTPIARTLIGVSAAIFLLTSIGAAHVVPALEDQDMETQGTAYALIHDLTPAMPTNRPYLEGSWVFFAHPMLLHFWIGESALISDDLDRLRHYQEGAYAARAGEAPAYQLWEVAFARFEQDPVLMPTRTPNLFLAVFVFFPLGFMVYRLTGSRAATAGACVLYATLPEVFVRSSYGGYMAVTNYLLMATAYHAAQATGLFANAAVPQERPKRARAMTAGAAFLGAWANHKSLLITLAAGAHAGVRALMDRPFMTQALGALRRLDVLGALKQLFSRADVLTALAIAGAFLAGWATFALYGLAIAPAEFYEDHILEHLVRRVSHEGLDFFGSEWTYPSVVGLWVEFLGHSGWLLIPPAALAAWHAATRMREAHGLLLLWVVIGALAFSVVDWRQTKHLALILPPLAALAAIYWASLEGRMRTAMTWILGAAIAWNIWRIGQVMNDFAYIQPTPIW